MPLPDPHDVHYGSSDEELRADLLQLLETLESVPSECEENNVLTWTIGVARHLAQKGFLERKSKDWTVQYVLAKCLAVAVEHRPVCLALGLKRLEAAVMFIIASLGQLVQHGKDIRAEAQRRHEEDSAAMSEDEPEQRNEASGATPQGQVEQQGEDFGPALEDLPEQQGEDSGTTLHGHPVRRGEDSSSTSESQPEQSFKDPDSSCCDLIKELHGRKVFVTLAATRLQTLLFGDLVQQLFDLLNTDNEEELGAPVLQLLLQVAGIQEVATTVLDAILSQLVEQRTVHAYVLVQRFLKEIHDELQSAVSQFLQWDMRNQAEPSVDVRLHVFRVLAAVYAMSPSITEGALLHLEAIMRSQDVAKRKAAVLCVSTVLSTRNVDLSFLKASLRSAFLRRFDDIDEEVRAECAACTGHLLLHFQEMLGTIAGMLKRRQNDPYVLVRKGIVRGISTAAKKDISGTVREEAVTASEQDASAAARESTDGIMRKDLLPILASRVFDTDCEIRQEASLALAFLYRRHASGHSESTLAWIANPVLCLYLLGSADDRSHTEKLFRSKLVPVVAKTEYRMQCLYHLHRNLNNRAKWAFSRLQKNSFKVFALLLSALHNIVGAGDSTLREKEQLSHIVTSLAAYHQDEEVATQALVAVLNELSENELLCDSLVSALDPENSNSRGSASIEDAISQLTSDTAAAGVFHSLLLTATCNIVGSKDIMALLTLLKEDRPEGQADNWHCISFDSSKDPPTLLQVLAGTFYSAFLEEDVLREVCGMLVTTLFKEQALRIFVELAPELHNYVDTSLLEEFVQVLQEIATNGTLKEVKLAIGCLARVAADTETVFAYIIEEERGKLGRGSERCRAAVVALGHVAYCRGTLFEENLLEIFTGMMQTWLLTSEVKYAMPSPDWCEYALLPEETKIKVECMKAFTRYVLGLQANIDLAKDTFSFLFGLIEKQQESAGQNGLGSSAEACWLRYMAVTSILKLCCCISYSHVLSLQQFQRLALIVKDKCWNVRQGFLVKLSQYLQGGRLPVQFLALFAHMAHDVIPTLRRRAAKALVRCIRSRQRRLQEDPVDKASRFLEQPDYMIPFAVHLLAHHPDLDSYTNVAVLTYIKKCLGFILTPLLRLSVWYTPHFYVDLLESIKQTRDAQDPSSEEATLKLYAVCDVALGVVISRGLERNVNIPPQKVALPMKLYVPQKQMMHWNKDMYLTKQVLFTPPRREGVDMRAFGLKRRRPPLSSSEESDEGDKYTPRRRYSSGELRTSFHERDLYSDFESRDDIDPDMLSVYEYLEERRSRRETQRLAESSQEAEESPEQDEEDTDGSSGPSSTGGGEDAIEIGEDIGARRMRMVASLLSSPSENEREQQTDLEAEPTEEGDSSEGAD